MAHTSPSPHFIYHQSLKERAQSRAVAPAPPGRWCPQKQQCERNGWGEAHSRLSPCICCSGQQDLKLSLFFQVHNTQNTFGKELLCFSLFFKCTHWVKTWGFACLGFGFSRFFSQIDKDNQQQQKGNGHFLFRQRLSSVSCCLHPGHPIHKYHKYWVCLYPNVSTLNSNRWCSQI